jgi:hypothetical protein
VYRNLGRQVKESKNVLEIEKKNQKVKRSKGEISRRRVTTHIIPIQNFPYI